MEWLFATVLTDSPNATASSTRSNGCSVTTAKANCPATTANWPACGYTGVEFKQQQIRAVDEPPTRPY
ncbi:hypothetical protein [Haloterrigena salina]|uniref:hypothetical protein n=1 Tax=Haloterrigena salina TaxID=504937 RepID=UPI0012697322